MPAQPPHLAEILHRCADRHADAAEALRRWQDGRLQKVLVRTLGNPGSAAAALDRLLADLSSEAGAFRGDGEAAAEDWLFARVRLLARAPAREARGAPKLYAVPSAPHVLEAPPAVEQAVQLPPQAPPVPEIVRVERDEEAPLIHNARLRRPSAPVVGRPISAVPEAGAALRKGRGWLRVTVSWIGAALIGFGLAVLALRWLVFEPTIGPHQVEPAADAPIVAAPPPNVADSSARKTPVLARELVGEPLVAREPLELAVTARPPALEPAKPTKRIVIHHGIQPEDAAVAQQLAQQLRAAGIGQVEVRSVAFDVATASVRYFHADDQAGAERLVAALAPFLSWHGWAAPRSPIDFTDFQPVPRPGTTEIWLPHR